MVCSGMILICEVARCSGYHGYLKACWPEISTRGGEKCESTIRWHWTRIRTNNVIERLNREIRRRTRVVGSFPDGNSALMLVCARLRHVAGSQWGNKKYMNMKHLEAAIEDASIAG